MENDEKKVIKHLVTMLEIDKPYVMDFDYLVDELSLPKERVDEILNNLERERYINQWVIGSTTSFKISLLQKGFDAAQN